MSNDRITLRAVGRAFARVIACQCFRLGLKFVPEADLRTLLAVMSLMNAMLADSKADTPASVVEGVNGRPST